MAQTCEMMPVRCRRCGEVFDLKYDMEDAGINVRSDALFEVLLASAVVSRMARLCWKCRAGE